MRIALFGTVLDSALFGFAFHVLVFQKILENPPRKLWPLWTDWNKIETFTTTFYQRNHCLSSVSQCGLFWPIILFGLQIGLWTGRRSRTTLVKEEIMKKTAQNYWIPIFIVSLYCTVHRNVDFARNTGFFNYLSDIYKILKNFVSDVWVA